jgi:hypothetical protein
VTRAVIFNIDGTLADLSHRLHHIQNGSNNWHASFAACKDDALREPIRDLSRDLDRLGYNIILVSGRTDKARLASKDWPKAYSVPVHELHMLKATTGRMSSSSPRSSISCSPPGTRSPTSSRTAPAWSPCGANAA